MHWNTGACFTVKNNHPPLKRLAEAHQPQAVSRFQTALRLSLCLRLLHLRYQLLQVEKEPWDCSIGVVIVKVERLIPPRNNVSTAGLRPNIIGNFAIGRRWVSIAASRAIKNNFNAAWEGIRWQTFHSGTSIYLPAYVYRRNSNYCEVTGILPLWSFTGAVAYIQWRY